MLSFLILVAAIPSAIADDRQVTDPDDNGGRLDIADASHGHLRADGRNQLRHVVTTFEDWDNSIFDNEGRPFATELRLLIDLGNDSLADRSIAVAMTEDGNLYATVATLHRDGSRTVRGYARVARPDARSIELVFPKSLLKKNLDVYRWTVDATFDDPDDLNCGDQGDVYLVCFDRAPNSRWVKHEVG